MTAQIIGNYTWYVEYDSEHGVAAYSNAIDDNEAIAAAIDHVAHGAPRVHVRRDGAYLAEVSQAYQRKIRVERHHDDGTVIVFAVPCLMRLAAHWLNTAR